MSLKALFMAAGVMLALGTTAWGRPRHPHQNSLPIIAGEPNVRVTPSGNVVARHHRVGRRIRNGRVPLPHHRLGPAMR